MPRRRRKFRTSTPTTEPPRVSALQTSSTRCARHPNAVFVGVGDAALAGLLALGIETERRAILDVGDFDVSSDAALLERLYMPGLRRAGDLSTAASLAGDRALIHNAGARFTLDGAQVRREKLTAKEIVALLK